MREASIHPRGVGRPGLRACVIAVLLATAAALGGCAGSGSVNGAYAMATSEGPTIAFEQIDGPPPDVFDRMVGVLDSESKLRNLAIVSRDAQPAAGRGKAIVSAILRRENASRSGSRQVKST